MVPGKPSRCVHCGWPGCTVAHSALNIQTGGAFITNAGIVYYDSNGNASTATHSSFRISKPEPPLRVPAKPPRFDIVKFRQKNARRRR